jgi:hypothetical protein
MFFEKELFCNACWNYWRFCDCIDSDGFCVPVLDENDDGSAEEDEADLAPEDQHLALFSPMYPATSLPRPSPLTRPKPANRPLFDDHGGRPFKRPVPADYVPGTVAPPRKNLTNLFIPGTVPIQDKPLDIDFTFGGTVTPSTRPPDTNADMDDVVYAHPFDDPKYAGAARLPPDLSDYPLDDNGTPFAGDQNDFDFGADVILDTKNTASAEPTDVDFAISLIPLGGTIPTEDYSGLTFNRPSINDLGLKGRMYSTMRNPSSTWLSHQPNVPHFTSPTEVKDQPSVEYTKWYDNVFTPWYDNVASPKEKYALLGVKCMEPPSNWERKWPGVPFDRYIYVTEHKSYSGGTRYSWEKDGKTYVKKRSPPSDIEVYFPHLFKDTLEDNWGTPRFGQRRRPIKFDLENYAFPIAHIKDEVFDLEYTPPEIEIVVPPPPPPPPPPVVTRVINSINSTVDSGDGLESNIYYPILQGNPNLWKLCTYQTTGNYASVPPMFFNINQPFFSSAILSRALTSTPHSIVFYAHTHCLSTTVSQASCIVSTLQCTGYKEPGSYLINKPLSVWRVMAEAPNGFRLPIVLNTPTAVVDLIYSVPGTDGFHTIGPIGTLNIGVYIAPENNSLFFDNNALYIKYTISVSMTPASTKGVVVSGTRQLYNRNTITPGYKPSTTNISFNLAGQTYQCINGLNNDLLNTLSAGAEPTGVDVVDIFTKYWVYIKGICNITSSVGTLTSSKKITSTSSLGWYMIPAIELTTATSNINGILNKYNTIIVSQGDQLINFVYGFREQHLNISIIWR